MTISECKLRLRSAANRIQPQVHFAGAIELPARRAGFHDCIYGQCAGIGERHSGERCELFRGAFRGAGRDHAPPALGFDLRAWVHLLSARKFLNETDQNASIDFQYRLSPHVTLSAHETDFQKSSNVF